LPPAAGRLAGIGTYGAYRVPGFTAEEALELAVRAIERAGFAPGEDIALGIAVGGDRLGSGGRYALPAEGRVLSADEMVARVLSWLARTPLAAIDDPLAPDDGAALAELTRRAGRSVAVRAPALTLGDVGRVAEAIEGRHGNAIGLSLLRAGTVTQAREAIEAAQMAGWSSGLHGEAGESEDASLAHVGVGFGVERLAAGGLLGGERTAIWNELLRIAEDLGGGRLPPGRAV
jgi:enolase